MFKNRRSLQVQMVKTPKNEKTPEETIECTHFDLDKIHEIVKEDAVKLAIVATGIYTFKVILTTTAKIAIIKASK